MKKNLILALVVILVLSGVLLLGNIIIIGEKVATLFPYADYVFYGIIVALIFFFLILPFLKVFFAPQMPALNEEEVNQLSEKEIYNLGITLARNNYYIANPEKRKEHTNELKDFFDRHYGEKDASIQQVASELEKRYHSLNEQIHTEALTAFVITGLSQNGKLDFITLLIINFRLVKKVVYASGFRPTHKQLIWIYYNVLGSALLTSLSDDMLEDIDLTPLTQNIKVPGFVITSFFDGLISALLTLRIGYITKYYILKGSKGYNRTTARRYGLKNARKEILSIAKQGKDILKEKMTGLMVNTTE
ncbi:hypothetical protein M2459_002422 [Parabacteroides sp. PF5-5]|uniref:DUF697 domain-containing protein n=1 Tax=unclassified Parabacteroides TaxID=2649774 RepID=UPI002475A64D|nr:MULTISPECIES: DUF697 domain-containing protein [unclassified Parabacteroides]MDH6305322.1 hypothetical protein [Parabacteroides sp. PH5-39]MDH6316675.1 hypothetical protein [Parabacteroides sp. PF5-13]MDH6320145.1 hypothetical protein [Parabacteroides sp. PH5-13]MDH6323912.1 hypothetical protein [Parabacteroides sp. PH5-8]MDH6327822.1 hypothetical protein [Parabacteroides sp. PH5-41]